MGGSLADRREDPLQLRGVGRVLGHSASQQAPRVHQRRDRCKGVVELVRDDPNDFLPDRNFLGRQLAGQLFEQHEAMRLSVEQEAPLREVVDLGLCGDFHGE